MFRGLSEKSYFRKSRVFLVWSYIIVWVGFIMASIKLYDLEE